MSIFCRVDDKHMPLYRVLFSTAELWDGYDGPPKDTTVADIYENWLENLP